MENDRILTKEEIEVRRVKMMQKAALHKPEVQRAIQVLTSAGIISTIIRGRECRIKLLLDDWF